MNILLGTGRQGGRLTGAPTLITEKIRVYVYYQRYEHLQCILQGK